MAKGSKKVNLNPEAPDFYPTAGLPHHDSLDTGGGNPRLDAGAQFSGPSNNVLPTSFRALSLLDFPVRKNTRLHVPKPSCWRQPTKARSRLPTPVPRFTVEDTPVVLPIKPEYTFTKFADLPDELQLKVLSFTLPQITAPITTRVQAFFGHRATILALLSRKFRGMVYELHYRRNGFGLRSSFALELHPDKRWRSTGPRKVPCTGISVGSYVHKIILTLTVPEEANNVGSMQELLSMEGDLQHVFHDITPRKYPRFDLAFWQKRSTQLRYLKLVFKVSACFSVKLKKALGDMERWGVCHLKTEQLHVCVEEQRDGHCHVDCAAVMEDVLRNMGVASLV